MNFLGAFLPRVVAEARVVQEEPVRVSRRSLSCDVFP